MMLQSRLRAIRKQKGLTLQEVAERAGTTAQTIGRLETGMRTVSIKWVNRIAKALGVEPATLLELPDREDIDVTFLAQKNGRVEAKALGVVALDVYALAPTALKVKADSGDYRAGDILICETNGSENLKKAIGHDCLVELKNGGKIFGKVMRGGQKRTYSLMPMARSGSLLEDQMIVSAAPAVALIRTLK